MLFNFVLFFILCFVDAQHRLKEGYQNLPNYKLDQQTQPSVDWNTINWNTINWSTVNYNTKNQQQEPTTTYSYSSQQNTIVNYNQQATYSSQNNYNQQPTYSSQINYNQQTTYSSQGSNNYNNPQLSSSPYSYQNTDNNIINTPTLNLDRLNPKPSGSYKTGPGCKLPSDPLIVPITPNEKNEGWAMSPDQTCQPGQWCPYACKSGYYSTQWDPQSKCANGPECGSMNGGLYCNNNNELEKPFQDKPLCSLGLNNVFINSKLKSSVAFCQTIYPGNEAMLIPTIAEANCNQQIINSPPNTYWQNTSAQYYVNPINTSQQHCIWGSSNQPFGNWAPFVLGIGQGYQSNTFISLTVNPNFINLKNQFKNLLYKIEVQCKDCYQVNNKRCLLDLNNNIDTACTLTIPQGKMAYVLLS